MCLTFKISPCFRNPNALTDEKLEYISLQGNDEDDSVVYESVEESDAETEQDNENDDEIQENKYGGSKFC